MLKCQISLSLPPPPTQIFPCVATYSDLISGPTKRSENSGKGLILEKKAIFL